MRIGEARSLKLVDIDLENGIVVLNHLKKNGNPRNFEISSKLVAMINTVSKSKDGLLRGKQKN